MLVLGISGSLRRGSYNRLPLESAGRMLSADAHFHVLEGVADVPPYDEEVDVVPAPAAVHWLRETIATADALVIASPEYNASVPGALKNAIDWASRPFHDNCLRGKPIAVIGASTGPFGAVWAQAELRKVLTAIGADVLDSQLAIPRADTAFGGDGRLHDPMLAAALEAVVAELLDRLLPRAA